MPLLYCLTRIWLCASCRTRVVFIQLLAVGRQRGCMLHVSSGWSRGKRACPYLGTLQVKSLSLDSSRHRKACNRTSELSVLCPRTWLSQPLGRNSIWSQSLSFANCRLTILLKLVNCILFLFNMKQFSWTI